MSSREHFWHNSISAKLILTRIQNITIWNLENYKVDDIGIEFHHRQWKILKLIMKPSDEVNLSHIFSPNDATYYISVKYQYWKDKVIPCWITLQNNIQHRYFKIKQYVKGRKRLTKFQPKNDIIFKNLSLSFLLNVDAPVLKGMPENKPRGMRYRFCFFPFCHSLKGFHR